jgi:hypothetical protein
MHIAEKVATSGSSPCYRAGLLFVKIIFNYIGFVMNYGISFESLAMDILLFDHHKQGLMNYGDHIINNSYGDNVTKSTLELPFILYQS